MTARLFRYSLLLAFSAWLSHVTFAAVPPPPAEPPGPQAFPAVETKIAEARRLLDAKQTSDSLKAATQALETAQQMRDAAGEALAKQARAHALQDLERQDEARNAWQEAAQVWARTGDRPEQIIALVQAGLLFGNDTKNEADRLFTQGLSVGKIASARPAAMAQALHDSGVAIRKKGDNETAYNYLAAALAIRDKHDPDSLRVMQTLNAIESVSKDRAIDGNDVKYYQLTQEYGARTADLGRRIAPDSPLLADSLHDLCFVTDALGSYAEAKEQCLEALRIQKQIAPGGSIQEARILCTLGRHEEGQSHFLQAHEYLGQALALGAKLAPESQQYEYFVFFMSGIEAAEGNLQTAHAHLLEALALQERLHGFLAPVYVSLASIELDQDNFAASREYSQKALDDFAKTKPNNVGVQYTWANLSQAAYLQGDLASALEYERHVLTIDANRPDGMDTAADYSDMGDILFDKDDPVSAAEYYQRALKIQEEIAPDSTDVSKSLINLAKVARAKGNRDLAIQYARRALAIGEKSCPNHWCVTQALNDLGRLAYEQGDLVSSESYFSAAAKAREESLGPSHPDLARTLNGLALTLAAQEKIPEALAYCLRAETIGTEHLRLSAQTLSERQALSYESIRASGLDIALTLAADQRGTPSARGDVFDALIRSRALVFDELATRHRSAYGSGDPEVIQIANQLASARAQLATLVFRGAGDLSAETYRKLLDDTRDKKEKAERVLAERSMAFRQNQARTQLGLKDINAALPLRSTLVAFVRYNRYDLHKPPEGKSPPAPLPSYAAFVLRAGEHDPRFVPLGPAREIDRLVAIWREEIARRTDFPDGSAGTDERYRLSGTALRRAIWDPLQPSLGSARNLFIVPDAALHLISMAALPADASHYLIETGPLIHYLSTERDLVPIHSRHGDGILVVGNPAFDEGGKTLVAPNMESSTTGATTGVAVAILRGTRSACGKFQTLRFPPLPASQEEADNIAALWTQSALRGPAANGLQQMTGGDASREAFEQYAPGKRVLHVATHGFFLEGSCESAVERRTDASKRDEIFLPAKAENPLLLSGLAFAGANRRMEVKADRTDGILTAEEIAGINLEGVDWAVLSACDTGVGEIKVGEGVFGLRRAFQIAGAKTVIMSLWPIEDEGTRQWMQTLYQEHFLHGKDTADSVRAASLHVLKQRRADHKSTHPFYWGAFIAAGDWH